MSNADLTLDVRNLPPPEPLERCLEKIWELAGDQRLHLLIDREPHPLFAILDRHGFEHSCLPENGYFKVSIWCR